METPKKKLLFVVTEDWYFWSHRLPMAQAARSLGFDVAVAARVSKHREKIENAGFRVIPLRMVRKGGSLWNEIMTIVELVIVFRRERAHIVHNVAIKPVVYGSFASMFAKIPVVLNTFAGLGFIFTDSKFAIMLRPFVMLALRILFWRRNQLVTVQNNDDAMALDQYHVGDPSRRTLIRGSGVDIKHFHPTPEPEGEMVITFVGRMLWDKGVGVLVEAARILRKENVPFRVVLVGKPDPANPHSIPEDDLKRWSDEGVVEWWGHRDDIDEVWRQSNVAVFPTYYREGVPKSLLEAAASARPLIATDMPGCRDVVIDCETGLLVKPKNPQELARAMKTLILSPNIRAKLGKNAYNHIEESYSDSVVSAETIKLYAGLLPPENC